MKYFFYSSLLFILCILPASSKEIIIGSKKFTESYVLGEIAHQKLKNNGFKVTHKMGLGGTSILWTALTSKAIDCYPEYTGTIQEVILKSQKPLSQKEMKLALAEQGIGITESLGFSNTYALAMKSELAHKLSISKISDLQKHPKLKVALSHEFIGRKDGWYALSNHYSLNILKISGLDHSLAYNALIQNQVAVIDVYSTDPKIALLNLVILKDDLNFFPAYNAVFLYNLKMPSTAIDSLKELEASINQKLMIQLNAKAETSKNYTLAANLYFHDSKGEAKANDLKQIINWTSQHLFLVTISMFFAILCGIPLGILSSSKGLLSSFIMSTCGVIQTIPSLSLLALLVPAFGISAKTAILALFMYSLLPIVKGTASGLQNIPNSLYEAAEVLGLKPSTQLLKIFLPLATRSILTGIKTSTIINIGTASLAALIGAGGLGEPIISGLNLNDNQMILQGALPAAGLAIVAQLLFDGLDKLLISRGLRSREQNSN